MGARTLTFLFTDVESSTSRWSADGAAMSTALADHDRVLVGCVEDHEGRVFKHTGDGVCAVFASANQAIRAAAAAQGGLGLPVRMGVHTGEAEERDGDFFGSSLNRVARITDAGHGGQVLVSAATAALLDGVELVELGTFSLKGLDAPERISQVGSTRFAGLRVDREVAGNVPVPVDAFVGREEEVAEVAELVGRHRVVTLIGVGGTGKTRLGLRVADELRWQFPDGCWVIDLASISSEEAAPFAVASGLGVDPPDVGDVLDHVTRRLGGQSRLVIVDNCEHVLDAAADAIERVIEACPNVCVLATSREPVMVRGEQLSAVPSLTVEDALELFLARARAEAPSLALDDRQMAAARELCERLDRLPLAIELAATRLRAQTPVELLAAVEERFRMLVGGRRSRVERHQTMRATLDWSYDLCDPTEQQVFDRLSVFAASFDLDAASQVAAVEPQTAVDVADVVMHLVDRSLLARIQSPDGTSRFRLLETMRAYGREHLQHADIHDEVRERHARWVGAQLRRSVRAWHQAHPSRAETRLQALLADATAAVDWHIDCQDWTTASLLADRARPVDARMATELIDRVWRAARAADQLDRLPATTNAFNVEAFMRGEIDPDELTRRLLDEIRHRSWRDPANRHLPLPQSVLGMPASRSLTPEEAHMVMRSLGELEDRSLLARFYAHQTASQLVARALSDIDPILDEMDRLAAAIGGPHVLGLAHHTRSVVAFIAGDLRGSLDHKHQALQLLPDSHPRTIQLRFSTLLVHTLLGSEIRPEHIREPWQQMRDLGFYAQAFAGAHSTGHALVSLNRPDAARRFFAWAKHPHWFARLVDDAFLETVRDSCPDAAELYAATEPTPPPPYEEIIDAALAICDELEQENQAPQATAERPSPTSPKPEGPP